MTHHQHGGNKLALAHHAKCSPEDILDFSANLNPLGPPEWLRQTISNTVSHCVHYPDPDCNLLKKAIAKLHKIPTETVIIGAGTNQLIHAIPRVIEPGEACVPVPSFAEYGIAASAAKHVVTQLTMTPRNNFQVDLAELDKTANSAKLVFLGHPNNPTGQLLDAPAIRQFAKSQPATLFVIDEAFADFCPKFDSFIDHRPKNLIVLRSLTKTFAIPGIRVGYAIADAAYVRELENHIPAWSVGAIPLAVAERAIADRAFVEHTRQRLPMLRQQLASHLDKLPLDIVGMPQANFLLLKITDPHWTCNKLADSLLQEHRIAIRRCENFAGLDHLYFRIAVRSEQQNDSLIQALTNLLAPRSRTKKPSKPTPALMLQGTGSNVGKSVLTAAFCRILHQDGYQVAPFKAQNMSLNAYVTRDGKEMGVAQAIQAQACRLDPDVRMNPILLKPLSTMGSQVILLGESKGIMSYKNYGETKKEARRAVETAYDDLAATHDVMVLEGAGSPAEVNLKSRDLVNMRMAKYAQAKVLLAGDIDRGGVYAAFVGTMEVLEEWERQLVSGFIVNRFRGDASLLGDAHDYLYRHVSKPVLGIVPYFSDLGLPQEDSVDFKSGLLHDPTPLADRLDLAVIDLPHAANIADLDPLHAEYDIRIRMVKSASELGTPDLIIIPGTRNVIRDLEFLNHTQLSQAIQKSADSAKTEIIGICGGCQMLGSEIRDPHQMESKTGRLDGLNLLPLVTELRQSKTVTQTKAKHLPSTLPVRGYEIHLGETTAKNLQAHITTKDGTPIGWHHDQLPVWGTYLHGVFDDDLFRDWFLREARKRKGITPDRTATTYDLEPALDRLADRVRQNVELDQIYARLGL